MRPPAEALAWCERTLGRGARIIRWRRLTGGLTSAVHELTVDLRGRREPFVLRRWLNDYAPVASESAALTALADTDIPAPRLVGSTTDAVLMTRVPGRMLLMPRDRDRWLAQMAQMLARVHAQRITVKPFESWLEHKTPPSDATRPKIWREAFAIVSRDPPRGPTCFLHRDFQHFNLLWSRERLTGVIDWVEASVGPPEVDVGHCRLNLALLFSVDVAERFRELYEAESGRALDPWWDIHALLSYDASWKQFLPLQIGNRAPFDAAGATIRVEETLARSLRRL